MLFKCKDIKLPASYIGTVIESHTEFAFRGMGNLRKKVIRH